jgi:LPS sulfotransferase NodH
MLEQAARDSYKPKIRPVIRRLYDRDADFNCFGREPIGSYMLATIPRSGSTYCAIRLWETGLLGAPMEYLNFRIMGDLFHRLGYQHDESGLIPTDRVHDYWHDVQRLRTSANGIFGYKMFTTNYVEISRRYPELLDAITPNFIVYLVRRDLLGQAISYSRAIRSKIWFGGVDGAPTVEYDYASIKKCIGLIEEQRKSWERLFRYREINPIRIYYEDLFDSNSVAIQLILSEMMIKPDPSAGLSVPMIQRQTDGVSKEWRERFKDDLRRDSSVADILSESL